MTLHFPLSGGLARSQSDGIIQALTTLGLELTPGREPLDLLIVEADKEN